MALKIECLVLGSFKVNTYILIDEKSKNAVVIDPGGDGSEIINFLEKKALKVEMIINTHGHPDHIEANEVIRNKYSARILIHPEDSKTYRIKQIREIENGDTINFGGETFKVIHTPGHTFGSVCLLGNDYMFTGDTIFSGGAFGRTDFGGDMDTLIQTLAFKFENIPDKTVLYPGHGPKTDLGYERRMNYYIQMAHDMR